MNIGVVCEGPSDFPAITHFFGHALKELGVNPRFRALFPEMDRTRPEGGWANVLLWLKNNPPAYRIQQYFGGGLFSGGLSVQTLDAILIQIDADVVEDNSFLNYVKKILEYDVKIVDAPQDRADEIRNVIRRAAQFEEMTQADVGRHVMAPAVEATETWCIAAFRNQAEDFEKLRGSNLVNAFMAALERSEGREPEDNYAKVDKSLSRRNRFCAKHAAGSSRISASCIQFSLAMKGLMAARSVV